MADSPALERIRSRLDDLEEATSDLGDRVDQITVASEVLKTDVRWILRMAMGAAAVVSTLISLAAKLL